MRKLFFLIMLVGSCQQAMASVIVNPASSTGGSGYNLQPATVTITAQNIQFASTTLYGIVGTTITDTAAAGNVGEYITGTATTVNAAASTHWTDMTSISLTAGDWDVTSVIAVDANTATWSRFDTGISTTSGDSTTGLTTGLNRIVWIWANSSTTPLYWSASVANYRVSINTTTTLYLKFMSVYSAGGPPEADRVTLYARRKR